MKRRCRSSGNAVSFYAGIRSRLIRDSKFEIKWPAGKSLSTETEIKVEIENVAGFCLQLHGLNSKVLAERHFEDNYLLDFPDWKLKNSQCLLRVRFARGCGFLTFKGPPRPESIFKIRDELETKLEDGTTMLQVLERIGMTVCFRYQKYRREFALDQVHVAVDETPIGNYVEFEGTEDAIRALAGKMGIGESRFLRLSYYSLYVKYCQRTGEVPRFMVY
jgi:adenylate cyclase, class 2